MKLLSFEIGDLGKDDSGKDKTFKSLHSGFKINFHRLTDKGVESMLQFQPFCFAGLNGSGKSNVLEALAAIFYHLEFCVAKFRPESFEKHFRRDTCTPDAFTLKYLTCSSNKKDYVLFLADIVTISKVKGEEPVMIVEPNPYSNEKGGEAREVSLISSVMSQQRAPGKEFLPDLVVGYSSGENEILSIPFIKNRLVHFDEYKEAIDKRPYSEPETSLIYIDKEMSQAVLLACLLFEDKETLKPLKDQLGILGIQSFRMNLNLLETGFPDKDDPTLIGMVPLVDHLKDKIEILKNCSTSWYKSKKGFRVDPQSKDADRITLDFFIGVDSINEDERISKHAFKDNFNSSFEFFRLLQVLYELNNNVVSDSTKEEVYQSGGFYTNGKLPSASPEDNVFYFLDYKILKQIEGLEKPKELLLREFSDGEHQFLHTMGICLMLKERRTLLLLDEPETHFNPGWRAKFIKVLNDSLRAGGTNNFLKDVILTSHSPFIISDCLPNNVIFFKRNKETHKVEAKSAKEMNFNTYGTSIEIISDELFEYNQSIGELSNEKLKKINFESINSKEEKEAIKQELKLLGESIEKDLVLAKLNRLKLD